MKKLTLIIAIVLTSSVASAQTDWSKVDFAKECKIQTKMPGGVAKSFKENPTFINDYFINQASLMKGSSQPGMLQKQGVNAVFSEVALGGVSSVAIQQLIDELHAQFVEELKGIGLNIIDGKALVEEAMADGKGDKKNQIVGMTDGQPVYDKVGIMEGSTIKEQNIFRPRDKYVYMTYGKVPGLFYQRVAKKENVNMISIGYTIGFANFDGSKTVSKNTLTTSAGLTITPVVAIVNPKGLFAWITFNKPVEGNNGWSKGLEETDSRDGDYWGLSSKGEYALGADQTAYINEVKSIVLNLQKDLAQIIKEEIN